MAEPSRGDLVMTIGVNKGQAKQQRNMLRANLILVAVLPVAYFVLFISFVSSDLVFALIGAAMVFLMIFWGFLFFEWALSRMAYPVNLYQNGIEFHLGLLDRVRGRKCYLPKEELLGGVLAYRSQKENEKGDPKLVNRITLITTKKKAYSASVRPAVDILRAAEYMEQEWGLIIENKPRPYKIKTAA